jgi:hypothetical protein
MFTDKSEVACRYFKKGQCQNGNRCEYSHADPAQEIDKSKSSGSRDRRSSPSGNEDTGSDSPPAPITSQFDRRPSREENTNFTDAPSSPSNEIHEDPSLLLPPGISEPAKIIPVE